MVLHYSHDVIWIAQIEVYSQENISIFNNLLFYPMCPVIDPKMCNLREIIGFLVKIQLHLNLYALKITV